MTPKMSVITPVYNCDKYIKESIESILSQTFSDFEFIIINDGSSDKTVEIIKSFKDKRIRFFNNSMNLRIPRRRNEAIRLARSPYIVIHDGDDISLPDRLQESFRALYNHMELFCVGGHAIKIDLDGNEIGMMDYPPYTHDDCLNMVKNKCMNPMIDPTTTFRKDVFLDLGLYTLEESIYTVPDFDLWLKAISSGHKFANMDFPLIKYRENPEGMTGRKKQEMIKAHMIVWTRFMKGKFMRKKNDKEKSSMDK